MQQQASKAAEVSRKVAKRGAKEARKAARRFAVLAIDTTKSMLGVGERRVSRRSNRTVTGRFINDIVSIAETTHLAGLQVDLSRVLIEPRFLPLIDIPQPVAEDDISQEVFHVIPRVPDKPAIMAPYNLQSYRIPELAKGNRRLAILGMPGSGRTTALMAIALWVMHEIKFPEPTDPVKQLLEEELANLSDRERREREAQKRKQEEAARESLKNAIESSDYSIPTARPVNVAEAAQLDESGNALPEFETLLPIFIHCADLNISAREFGTEIDPAEPLVRAVQRRVGTLTARTIPPVVYQRLEQNRTLILMDGYDDLPEAERRRVEAWLSALLHQYPGNFLIMTGPAMGYGNLMRLDITPLLVKPWSPREVEEYIEKWASQWTFISGTRKKPGPEASLEQIKRAKQDTYALTPAELTLKIWAAFASDKNQPHLDMWLKAFIEHHLPKDSPLEEAIPLLKMAATLQIDLGFATRQGIYALLKEQERVKNRQVPSKLVMQQLDVDGDGVADEDIGADDEDFEDEEDEEMIRQRKLLSDLVFSGMLVAYRGGRYRFRHSMIADYLAGLTLKGLPEEDPAKLYELAQKPHWQRPLAMAVMHTNLDNVVRMKLLEYPDMLLSNILNISPWLALSWEEPAWRNELFSRLGNAFVHQNQYAVNRERVAAALVESRDHGGALRVFEVGLNNPNPDVRRLSCLGIGAMGRHGESLVPRLIERTYDTEQDVQLAAIHALSVLNTEDAQNALVEILVTSDKPKERLAQAVTENLAANPEIGYMTLYEAVDHEELQVRRTALFGVQRIERDWAKDLIRQVFLREREFMARVVAQEAFLRFESGLIGPSPIPHISSVEWVNNWAEARDMGNLAGEQGLRLLVECLNDRNPEVREYGALAVGVLGVTQGIKILYNRLKDPNAKVREAAQRALVELQIKMGHTLPNPI